MHQQLCTSAWNMPIMIAVITQEEDPDPELSPDSIPTMAHPIFKPIVLPQETKKKLIQMTLWAKKGDAPAPDSDFIEVSDHKRGSSSVSKHRRYTTPTKSCAKNQNKKMSKTKNKTQKIKQTGCSKAKADCPETVSLAHSLHIQYITDLVRGVK